MTVFSSAARFGFLGLVLCLQLGKAPARSPRTGDRVSEDDVQRLLHGVMEQLGIARPRVEYPAHQATNIVGPQSIQGRLGEFFGVKNKDINAYVICSALKCIINKIELKSVSMK